MSTILQPEYYFPVVSPKIQPFNISYFILLEQKKDVLAVLFMLMKLSLFLLNLIAFV